MSTIIGGHTTVTTTYQVSKEMIKQVIAKDLGLNPKEITVSYNIVDSDFDSMRACPELRDITVTHTQKNSI